MLTDLGFFGGRTLSVNGLNEKGWLVGGTNGAAAILGFLYADGQLYDLNTLLVASPGWSIQDASGINGKGQIVGTGCRNFTCGPVRLDPVSKQR